MALGALLPENIVGAAPLVERVACWAADKPGAPAYTFVDYALHPSGVSTTLTWADTDRRARALAARLRRSGAPGERVAVLLPQGLDYVVTMIGSMRSRMIAVPLFSPELPGHADRLVRAYADSDPALLVTTRGGLPHVERFLADHDVPRPREIIFAEEIDATEGAAAGWADEPIDLDEVAYLQYTSGSTRTPAGVQITHRNVTANALQVWTGWTPEHPQPEMISWLPLFHDMGLIATMALPMVNGAHGVFTDPVSFVMNPLRWMRLLSGREWAYTAGPNFAYEYAAAQATPAKIADLDLSGLVRCLNGAEPVRSGTVRDFQAAFGPAGLRPSAQTPGYGLAEATVFVTAAADDEPPKMITVTRDDLAAGTLVQAPPADRQRTVELVACGRPIGQLVAIVDPETRLELPDGRVGEIWIHGPNVAPGYWRNGERSQEVFAGLLAEPGELPAGPWLRTGDHGVAHEGELYVTGRIKDLIIVDGRNHYPQDIELTVEEAHPAIRPEHAAAFAVPGPDTELLVVVAERNRRVPLRRLDLDEVENAVRAAVTVEHEMNLHEFVLVEPGAIPRTSSGKIARAATRRRHLDGALPTTANRHFAAVGGTPEGVAKRPSSGDMAQV